MRQDCSSGGGSQSSRRKCAGESPSATVPAEQAPVTRVHDSLPNNAAGQPASQITLTCQSQVLRRSETFIQARDCQSPGINCRSTGWAGEPPFGTTSLLSYLLPPGVPWLPFILHGWASSSIRCPVLGTSLHKGWRRSAVGSVESSEDGQKCLAELCIVRRRED